MNVSSSTSIGSQYAVTASTQKAQQNQAPSVSGDTQDTVELSAEAREKYEQAKGDLSSDFDQGSPQGVRPPGGPPPSGGAQGKGSGSAASDDSQTIQSLLEALTDEEDTNGDGVVDERDEQTTASKAATELKSKLSEWLAGDKTTTVGSYSALVEQLSGIDSASSQEESAS